MTIAAHERTLREPNAARRAFVVVGMHRSGTSAMARTLSLLGAALPKQLMLAHEDNPSGFWEPQSVADLNDEILEALDSEWDDVFAFRPKQYLSNFDQFHIGRAVDVLEQEFNGSEVIVLKDPRISVLTTFWDRALREAGYSTHYIVMVRNPLEVAESLRMRDSFPREKSLLLWSSYMIAVDRDTRERERTFVSYDQLMSEWRSVRDRLQADTGIPFPRDTAAAAIEIDRFLDHRLHHHQATPEDLLLRADVAEEVKTLYRIFSGACEGADVDPASVEAVQAEFEKIDSIVGPLVADLKNRARNLERGLAELHEAKAGDRKRADSLAEQLGVAQAERDRLAAEVEAKGSEAAELTARIAAVEAERDGLAAVAEDKSTEVTELTARLTAAETERDGMAAIIVERASEAAEIAERLEKEQARSQSISNELQNLSRRHDKLSLERAKLERRFNDAEADVRRSEQRFREEQRKAETEIQSAHAAVVDGENKLADRFRELATLSDLLQEQEQRTEEARERLRWLAALDERIRSQPRWWSFMPRAWRRAREQERLKLAGLFDGEAYLAAHPDVAADGIDPLRHYVRHGIHESRRRA